MYRSTTLRRIRTIPLPYFTISIFRSLIQCRSVHGRIPRTAAACTTVRSSSAAICVLSDQNRLTALFRTPPEGDVRNTPRMRLRISGDGRPFLVLGIRLQHEIANAFLRVDIGDRAQQRKGATFTVHGVLARREGDVATATAATLPDGEADQLQACELAVAEVQLGIGEFAGRVAFVVRCDLDDHDVTS